MSRGENTGENAGENTGSRGRIYVPSMPGTDGVSGVFDDDQSLQLHLDAGGFGANGPSYEVEFFDSLSVGHYLVSGDTFINHFGTEGSNLITGDALSKGRSLRATGHVLGGSDPGESFWYQMSSTFTEFYMQSALKPPVGYYFPDTTSLTNPFTAAANMNSKILWVLNEETPNPTCDVVIPVLLSSGIYYNGNTVTWSTSGNGFQGVNLSNVNVEGWTTFCAAAKAAATNPNTVNGKIMHEIWNGLSAHRHREADRPVFYGGSAPFYFKKWQFYSYIRTADSPGSAGLLFDHIYIAVGPYANARVVVTDNADYASSTRQAIQPHTYWSNTDITVNGNLQDFSGQTGHFHVIPAGYPETPIYVGTRTGA
jgi:hypothetical protein